ncbi:MAG: FdtA/QdtA family cupin domain-containing protein [Candidatus Aminicenantes bacterium]|nr:MAG: FdtA/QdtA family cupin domain-containing protein [Candidatus Aminicenantes bacterium]
MDTEIIVKHARFIQLKTIVDGIDGTISVAENFIDIPFEIKRAYYIYNLNNPNAIRGKHAHKKLEQVLFCINGTCEIGLDDGTNRQTIILDNPHIGIYLGIELWHTMKNFTHNCILLVLAADIYKESDYIRDYDEFIKYINRE